jgi:hypothetical protein
MRLRRFLMTEPTWNLSRAPGAAALGVTYDAPGTPEHRVSLSGAS